MPSLAYLAEDSLAFPDTRAALEEPNGLLAVGGDLRPQRLLEAYRRGIFPWFNEDEEEPVLWWTPSPRAVIEPTQLHLSSSFKKFLHKQPFSYTANRCFSSVIRQCQKPRPGQAGTWIGEAMIHAYEQLHQLGYAHSIEVWDGAQLVGGLYGLALGQIFFGESMFSHQSNASKCALLVLCQQLQARGFPLIDCQVESAHLLRMGAKLISRPVFERYLQQYISDINPQRELFAPNLACLKI